VISGVAPRGSAVSRPRVIVAPNALIYGLGWLFQVIGKATRPNLHVVRKLPKAFALLGVAAPRFQPFEPRSQFDRPQTNLRARTVNWHYNPSCWIATSALPCAHWMGGEHHHWARSPKRHPTWIFFAGMR
jgi:hypothetical protein